MVPQLSSQARDFVDEAVAQELPFPAAERERIRRGVLAAVGVLGTTATTSATARAALAAGKSMAGAVSAGGGVAPGAGFAATGKTLLWLCSGFVVGLGGLAVAEVAFTPGVAMPPRAPVPAASVIDVAGKHGPIRARESAVLAPAGSPAPEAAPPSSLRLPSPHPGGPARPAPPPPPHADPTSPARSSLADELTLLERVQTELRAGRGSEALRLLDGSEDAATNVLLNERLTAEVIAACQEGDQQRARRAAEALVARSPDSPAAERVRTSCAFRVVPGQGDE